MFIGNVDRCMDFLNQSIIRSNNEKEEEVTPESQQIQLHKQV